MREQPESVLKRTEQAVLRGDRIVVSAVTYAEMRFGATGPKASPRHIHLVDAFCARLDAVLPGTGPRWTPRRTSGWRCASPGRRSARTTRPLPGTPSRRAPSGDEQCERVCAGPGPGAGRLGEVSRSLQGNFLNYPAGYFGVPLIMPLRVYSLSNWA